MSLISIYNSSSESLYASNMYTCNLYVNNVNNGVAVGNTYNGIIAPTNSLIVSGNVGIGTSIPMNTLAVAGGVAVGSTYNGVTAPTNCLIVSGNVGIGTTVPSALLQIAAGTNTVAPIKMTTGSNLSTIDAGTIEYDGTSLYITPSTNYGRATIPATLYTSGIGTSGITLTTNYALFPSANDTITLPIGTYLVKLSVRSAVAGSTVSSVFNINLRGAGNAAGTFSWRGVGSILDASAASSFVVAATALGTVITVTATSAANPRQYIAIGEGILKVTTGGTIIPSYQYAATLTSGTTTLVADNYMIIQTLDTQSAAAFGPAGAGWG